MIAIVPAERMQHYRLMLIEDAHKRAIQRQTNRQEGTMAALAAPEKPEIKLTEMQVGILARGMNSKEFHLMGGEAGKSSGFLVARGLIKQIRKGVYTVTTWGHDAYQSILAGHAAALDSATPLIDAASGLNINDPSLYVVDSPGAKRDTEIERLNKTIDELNRLVDTLTTENKHLILKIDERDLRIEALLRDNDRLKTKGKAS